MVFEDKTHLMIDLETFGLRENAIIISLGITKFRFTEYKKYEDYIKDGIFIKFDVKDQIKNYNREWDESTVKFWKRQPDHVRKENCVARPDDFSLVDGLRLLKDYITSTEYIWRSSFIFSRGNAFDFGKLDHAYEKNLKVEPPYNKFMERDVRTYIDFMTGTNDGKYNLSYQVEETKHSPLSDAAMDAARMVEIFKLMTE